VISKRTGYLLVAAACTMFSCNGIVGRIAIDGGIAPSQVSAIRICGAALLLLPFVIRAARRFRRPMLVPMTLYAVVGLVAAQGLFFEAVAELDVAIVLVIVGLLLGGLFGSLGAMQGRQRIPCSRRNWREYREPWRQPPAPLSCGRGRNGDGSVH
jgi:drug/metabolite transporter (DMT)-like permease